MLYRHKTQKQNFHDLRRYLKYINCKNFFSTDYNEQKQLIPFTNCA